MREAGVVINFDGDPLYWHTPEDRSSVILPDSRKLWEQMLRASQQNNLLGFAHSHPGHGVPRPSMEDLTTFAATELGLGRRLHWWIISSNTTMLLFWTGPRRLDYFFCMIKDPSWADKLRLLSEVPHG